MKQLDTAKDNSVDLEEGPVVKMAANQPSRCSLRSG